MPMKYKPSAEGKEVKPPLVANNNAFLGDIFNSEAEKGKQISSGFYKQEAGEPLVFTYKYDEMKIILEVDGVFTISDENGYKVEAKPGDVFYFTKDSTITFHATGYGYAFFVGLRGSGEL